MRIDLVISLALKKSKNGSGKKSGERSGPAVEMTCASFFFSAI
jgi:hypothetical protein